ncbi:MAG TPA: DUF4384 domain-containing protein [Blastocatellia bacterium]|nr:DUF4384 domain-containing protein [Blastocatellia bacterium]
MRSLIKPVSLSLIAAGALALIAISAPAQGNQEQEQEVLHRAIRQKYAEGKDDGLNVVIYKIENGERTAINPASHTFKKGDQIKIEFQSNFDGYVYFINIPPEGEKVVFYPDIRFKDNSNVIRAHQRYILPRNTIFEFEEDRPGMEVIQVVMSRTPIPFLEYAVRNSEGVVASTAEGAASELKDLSSSRGGYEVEKTIKVIPDKEAVLTRSVKLAPPKDRDKEGAVVTVPDKLKPGEVAVFEVRLRRG